MSTPNSTIYICGGVRLDNRYDHSIWFNDVWDQRAYFEGKVVKTFSSYSYLRKTWTLQVAATMGDAWTWNYLFFRNGDFGKVYYYFITNIEYKNNGMVELALELDVIQTYLFDFSFENCFVERTHTTSDVAGAHTIDEGLEVGELIDNNTKDWSALASSCILVLASFNPNYADTEKPVPALSGMYDGVFSGLKVWAVNSSDWADWGSQLDSLSEAGFLDGIVSMWMYPKALVELGGENTWDDDDLCKTVDGCASAGSYTYVDSVPKDIDGYTPRNKKLLSYPYSMLYATNNAGSSAVYRYERFPAGSCKFECKGSLSPDGVVKMYPVNYNGSSGASYDYGLTLPNFPACAWDADMYKMWLAQNQNQHNFAMGTAGVKAAGGVLTSIASLLMGNVAGAAGGAFTAVSGGLQIGELLAQKADMEIQPPQSRGSFSSSVNMVAGKHTFSFTQKSITAERARVLDDYFDMYGYKVSRVMVPQLRTRQYWTYIKTVGCLINGNMCTEDVVKIESIFDHGITFWTEGDQIGNYDRTNSVL